MRAPLRSWLAAAVVAAVLAYGVGGHGLPQMSSHEGMAGAAIGLCLLLVNVLSIVALSRPEGRRQQIRAIAVEAPTAPPTPAPLDAKARASPSALQRFRN